MTTLLQRRQANVDDLAETYGIPWTWNPSRLRYEAIGDNGAVVLIVHDDGTGNLSSPVYGPNCQPNERK